MSILIIFLLINIDLSKFFELLLLRRYHWMVVVINLRNNTVYSVDSMSLGVREDVKNIVNT